LKGALLSKKGASRENREDPKCPGPHPACKEILLEGLKTEVDSPSVQRYFGNIPFANNHY